MRSDVQIGIEELLMIMVKVKATDLALIPSVAPTLRVAESWRQLDMSPLKFVEVREYAEQLMALVTEPARENRSGYDFTHERHGRFRFLLCNHPDTVAVLLIRLGAPA